ncbi:alpha-amylase family glycosyl hydrolase [Deinococcus ruber]|uniref:Alpha-amylase n=1 Tax=Deinococcus ruber TaxID=1848197 RepID=A0A918FII1_9DEIO|nr:alpha-amylase family glycosyl hydrolase [Deinococcus ruber]GGR39546.1 alpha-amylase [Deinococcus ruber]
MQPQSIPASALDTWRKQVIYLLLPDRFANGNTANDNLGQPNCYDPANPTKFHGGDLAGLRQKLAYISGLGATTVWTTPLYKQTPINSGAAAAYGNCGYHGYWADFNQAGTAAVEPKLGTSADVQGLITDIHNSGMKYLMDMVANHSGYGAQIVSQQPSWFHASCDPNVDPVNCPLAGLPDFRQENSAVASYLTTLSKTWVSTYAIDGIRMDTVKHVPTSYWQTSWIPGVLAGRPGMFLLGEVFQTGNAAQLKPYLDAGFDATFNFPLRQAFVTSLGQGGSLDSLAAAIQDSIGTLGLDRTLLQVNLLDNHDVQRFLNEPGPSAAESVIRTRYHLAMGALMTLPGIPQLYYGDELGMYGGPDPDNRHDMPAWAWTDTGRSAAQTNFLAGGGTPKTTFDDVKNLIALRQGNEALWKGSYAELWRPNGGQSVFAFYRGSGTSRMVVALNSSTSAANVALDIQGNTGISTSDKAAMTNGSTFSNLIAGAPSSATVSGGKLNVSVPAGTLAIYRLNSSASTVNVTFKATASTTLGQNLYLSGDRAELGSWNTAAAIPMTSSNCSGSTCTWTASVALPPSVTTQFKFIKKPGDSGASVTWEGGSNRSYTAPASGTGSYTGTWQP